MKEEEDEEDEECACDHSHESEILLVNDKSKIPLESRDSCVSV